MRRYFLIAAALAVLPTLSVGAQSGASSPWAPWLGCWKPAESLTTAESVTCVLPGESNGQMVDIISFSGDTETGRTSLTADGARSSFAEEGCTGWESAHFSEDGARVYVSGAVSCGARAEQLTSNVFSITPTGAWLNIRGVKVGDQSGLNVARFVPVADSYVPQAVRDRVSRLGRAVAGERIGAAVAATIPAIVEVSDNLPAYVAESWLIETAREDGIPLEVNAAAIRKLADAGVPERVIDMTVALAYPDDFQILASPYDVTTGIERAVSTAQEPYRGGVRYPPNCSFSPYWGTAFMDYDCFMNGYYAPYGRDAWGFARYGSYPGYFPGYGWPGTTVVVRPIDPGTGPGGGGGSSGGRVVKGRGYSSGSGSSSAAGSSAAAREAERGASSTARGSTSSGSGSSSASTSSKGSSGTSTGGRTAKPRQP